MILICCRISQQCRERDGRRCGGRIEVGCSVGFSDSGCLLGCHEGIWQKGLPTPCVGVY